MSLCKKVLRSTGFCISPFCREMKPTLVFFMSPARFLTSRGCPLGTRQSPQPNISVSPTDQYQNYVFHITFTQSHLLATPLPLCLSVSGPRVRRVGFHFLHVFRIRLARGQDGNGDNGTDIKCSADGYVLGDAERAVLELEFLQPPWGGGDLCRSLSLLDCCGEYCKK